MADAYLNGSVVLQGDMIRPYSGRWTARVQLDGMVSPGDTAQLRMLGADYVGQVRESGMIGGRGSAMVVGGGGLDSMLTPKHYRSTITVQTLLSDWLGVAGVSLSATVDPAVLSSILSAWTVGPVPVLDAIDALAEYLRLTWRVLQDGTVWLGADAWAVTSDDWRLIDGSPDVGRLTVAAEVATFGPGVSLADGLRILSVKHTVTPERSRSIVRLQR